SIAKGLKRNRFKEILGDISVSKWQESSKGSIKEDLKRRECLIKEFKDDLRLSLAEP
ncbi:hypothetical protein SK128_027357, partial [Halocaridina rubra]